MTDKLILQYIGAILLLNANLVLKWRRVGILMNDEIRFAAIEHCYAMVALAEMLGLPAKPICQVLEFKSRGA